MSWKFVLSLFFSLVVAIFAIQNAEVVSVNFLFKKVAISQALIILVSAILGAVIVALLGLIGQVKLKTSQRNDKKAISLLEEENKELKAKLAEVEFTGVDKNNFTDEQVLQENDGEIEE
jgi:uncharacterized integral membrane protein